MYSGLEMGAELNCDFFTILDADLQDPPQLLVAMFDTMVDSVNNTPPIDIVAAYRSSRDGEPRIRSFLSNSFYSVFNRISQIELKPGARDFRLMTRRAVEAILSLPESMRFSKGIFQWVGFRTEWIPYENNEQEQGESSWNIRSLTRYALQGILSFSTVPLEIVSLAGFLIVLLALILLIAIVIRALIFGDPVAGWPSLVCLIVFFAGLQILSTAIVGLYISRIYNEVKRRPLSIIREKK